MLNLESPGILRSLHSTHPLYIVLNSPRTSWRRLSRRKRAILPLKRVRLRFSHSTPRLLIILSSYLLHPADRWSICNGKSGSGDKSPEIAVIWNSPPTPSDPKHEKSTAWVPSSWYLVWTVAFGSPRPDHYTTILRSNVNRHLFPMYSCTCIRVQLNTCDVM